VTVLIIDDDDLIVEAASEYLMRYGYEVETAREFGAAKSLLLQRYFKVVLMDLRVTGGNAGDGLKMVGWIRDQFPSTKIGVLTESASKLIEQTARGIGVSVFLNKPANLRSVLTAVQALSAPADDPSAVSRGNE
jgi:DNA-binding response OmpR family regulator